MAVQNKTVRSLYFIYIVKWSGIFLKLAKTNIDKR